MLRENTVKAENQLQREAFVSFSLAEKAGIKVLFLGNSMTRHGAKPEIGWPHDHGMAASAEEKDYVHLLMARIRADHADASFCICQGAEWERRYRRGQETYRFYKAAREFAADVIIMRLIENCPYSDFDGSVFKKELWDLLTYLNPLSKARIILTTGFWKHPGDAAIRALALEKGLPLAELGDLGERAEMRADGLFAHKGVARHPGDLGMEAIASRIFAQFSTIQKKS